MNLIVMDCRGLEFVEFKPDVRTFIRGGRWVELKIGTDLL